MDRPIPILVVSSEFKNRYALRDILNREGWKTICASTVSECEEVFVTRNIDLVFCERSLTDGTYRDILAITRSRRQSVRLVVTSRLADWDEYLEALHEGAFDLIISPAQTADIVRVINQTQREAQMTGTPGAHAWPQGSPREGKLDPRHAIIKSQENRTNILSYEPDAT